MPFRFHNVVKSLLFLVALYFKVVPFAFSQTTNDNRIQEIQRLEAQIKSDFLIDRQVVEQKAKERGIPLKVYLENNTVADLQYFDKTDQPVYYSTFNANAAVTTGANLIRRGGNTGLNLSGRGIIVGVWDQDASKNNHVEFGDRVIQRDNATQLNNGHGTHVMGTIIGNGTNPDALGMAPEAIGWIFDWNNDLNEMIQNAYDPLLRVEGNLISNHSYGSVLGWRRGSDGSWSWFGNPSISEQEDWRFGFYSDKAKALDDIAVLYPYYTVFWAAGNDRSDVGDGSRRPDGPDNSIIPEATAKNILTIGAVSRVDNYTGPQSVNMSSFSNWGPTDDGRIKPDLVAMGVNVFSAYFDNTNGTITDSYRTLSGTSMASPNAAGSLTLIQELYGSRNNGRFLKSATLKGLAIHTTKEAGEFAGPDYRFGWGLLDVNQAAQLILSENGSGVRIIEETLQNGGEYVYEINARGVGSIKATLSWTDPSGTPPPPSLNPTTLMLVNDLDLRIFDEEGNEFFPWSLDPAAGVFTAARRDRDNFRDNIEQILIDEAEPKKYTLRVRHKNQLTGGSQPFSLIVTAEVNEGNTTTLYWVGGQSEQWNDVGNWSLTSGGAASNRVPDVTTRVVFDSNSFTGDILNVNIDSDVSIHSLNWFGNFNSTFDLNGNELMIQDGLRISNQGLSVRNGKVVLNSSSENEKLIDLGSADFSSTTLDIMNGAWKLLDARNGGEVIVSSNSQLDVSPAQISVRALVLSDISRFRSQQLRINNINSFEIMDSGTTTPDLSFIDELNMTGTGTLSLKGGRIKKLSFSNSNTSISDSFQAEKVTMNNALVFISSSVLTEYFEVQNEVSLIFDGAQNFTIQDDFIRATNSTLSLSSIAENGKFELVKRFNYCFESLEAEKVDLIGNAVVNVGSDASKIISSSGWKVVACSEAVFANFEVLFPCEGSIIEFKSLSEGPIETIRWNVNGTEFTQNSFFFTPSNSNPLTINISVSSINQSDEFTQIIQLLPNALRAPDIVVNDLLITSSLPGRRYQWFLNGDIINGATSRSFTIDESGFYQVAIYDESCNRISAPLAILSIGEESNNLERFGLRIWPNPVIGDNLFVEIDNSHLGSVNFMVYDVNGRTVVSQDSTKDSERSSYSISTSNLRKGVYFLMVTMEGTSFRKKFMIH